MTRKLLLIGLLSVLAQSTPAKGFGGHSRGYSHGFYGFSFRGLFTSAPKSKPYTESKIQLGKIRSPLHVKHGTPKELAGNGTITIN